MMIFNISQNPSKSWNLYYPRLPGFYFYAGRKKDRDQDDKIGKRGRERCQQRTNYMAGVGGKQWTTSLVRQSLIKVWKQQHCPTPKFSYLGLKVSSPRTQAFQDKDLQGLTQPEVALNPPQRWRLASCKESLQQKTIQSFPRTAQVYCWLTAIRKTCKMWPPSSLNKPW